jgi:chemotaxis protein CheX
MFKVQGGMGIQEKDPYRVGQGPDLKGDLIAVFNVITQGANLCIALCFEEKNYLGIMGKLLKEKVPGLAAGMEDGVKEMVNIIFAKVKKLMSNEVTALQRGIPTVVIGNGLKVSYLTLNQTIIIPFETEAGSFHMEINME